jgi:hypothetical protein|tara:strand:- start:206 stop:472 length:267 start_codon:yes stop_codon:yes gene_type:complete
MKGYEVLGIVLETADKLTEEGNDEWNGSINDFVSASVMVCDRLSSQDVRLLHKEMKGSSFLTGESEIFFYSSDGTPQITVLPTLYMGV